MNPLMDHEAFKQARLQLGLSVAQCADVLGVGELMVRRMEMRPGLNAARPVSGPVARLMRAFLDGYRPKEWPPGAAPAAKRSR
jgi:DNA-binding transcriptional regulator YiaG